MVAEQVRGKAFRKAQGIEHEFETGVLFGKRLLITDTRGAVGLGQVLIRLAQFAAALDGLLLGVADLAVGAGANTEIIAELPVVEIVATLTLGLGKGRYLIVPVTGLGQLFMAAFLHGPEQFILWQRWRLVMKQGVGFQRQLIMGNVARLQGDGRGDVFPRLLQGLLRQAEHEIEIEIVEAGVVGRFGGANGLAAAVNAADPLQGVVVEALRADGKAVDAQGTEFAKLVRLEGARVGLHGDLGVGGQVETGAQAREQFVQGRGGKQAGRAAADKEAVHLAAPDVGQLLFQVAEQRRHIAFLGNVAFGLMGIEVAIGTFAHTPGDVHIKAQGRQGGEIKHFCLKVVGGGGIIALLINERRNAVMMELYLSKILKSLIFPPGGLLLLWLLGLLLLKRYAVLSKGLLWGGLVIAYLLCTPLVSGLLLQRLQAYPALTPLQIEQAPARAIVVLSAGRYKNAPEYGGDTVGNQTLARVRYAAYLQRMTGLPLLVSGGHVFDREGDSMARVMADSLRQDFGIENVWLEDESRTTAENARFSCALLREKGIDSVFLVTHAMHMPRAVAIFEQAGLKVIPAPTRFYQSEGGWLLQLLPDAEAVVNSYMALHELVGGLWYTLRY